MFIDVRTRAEYDIRHADNAVNVPLSDLASGKIGVLVVADKQEAHLVYGRNLRDAESAKEMMTERGFTDITVLGGLRDVLDMQHALNNPETVPVWSLVYPVLLMAGGAVVFVALVVYLLF